MKKFAILAIAALVGATAFGAASWVGDSYIIVNDAWYNGSGDGNPEFNNLELYELTLSGTLNIHDADGLDWGGGDWDAMHYAIDLDPQNEVWNTINMKYVGGGYGQYQNDMRAQADATVVDISGLAEGSQHTLTVYFGPVDGQYDSGNNFVANFTKVATPVPEPATMSLLGLGALAMVIRRKLSK